jgi:Holliday junction resolvase RusA-like endonuclease
MEPIRIHVPAIPVAQPRARAGFRHGHVSVYTPDTIGEGENKRAHPIHAFKATVRMAARDAYSGPPLTGPLRVDAFFVFPRQKSKTWKTKPMPRYWHTEKPDLDNVLKGALDALRGLMWIDDTQVCAGDIQKWRAAGDEQPHCVITISKLE